MRAEGASCLAPAGGDEGGGLAVLYLPRGDAGEGLVAQRGRAPLRGLACM